MHKHFLSVESAWIDLKHLGARLFALFLCIFDELSEFALAEL